MQINPLTRYFYDLKVLKVAVIDGKANECPHLMPSLQACCSRVDVEQSQLLIIQHFQDMAVAGDEEFGRFCEDLLADARVVVAWIAAYMGH